MTTLHIWTFNINSIKNKVDIINNLLIKHDIDVLLVTETKIKHQDSTNIQFKNYHCLWNSNKTSYHHGIVFIYKKSLQIELLYNQLPEINHEYDITAMKNKNIIDFYLPKIDDEVKKAHYHEGRILVIKMKLNDIKSDDIIIVGTYVPNSGVDKTQKLKRLAYRTLCWDYDLYQLLIALEKEYKKVIWLGDLNVVIYNHDVLNTKCNFAGVTEEERLNINTFLNQHQWIDTWDVFNKDIIKCHLRATWGLKTRFPMRLDYILCTSALHDCVIKSIVDQQFEGSDHVPVGTMFKL